MDFDIDLNLDIFDMSDDPEEDAPSEDTAKAHKTIDRQLYRRFTSECQLEKIIDWDFEKGAAYHIISSGDIDSLTFLRHILKQQKLEYCLLSTWCMNPKDCEELSLYMQLGRIQRLDSYVGEIFKGRRENAYLEMLALHKQYGGRLALFRNHSKIFCGFGDKFDFVVESSANINTNPRTENTVITIDTGLALFYKNYFDAIKSIERNFDNWKPYDIRR